MKKVIQFPEEGFVGIHGVLAVIPVSRSTWYQGIKDGRFPEGIKLGPKTRVWPVADIRDLIAVITNGVRHDRD